MKIHIPSFTKKISMYNGVALLSIVALLSVLIIWIISKNTTLIQIILKYTLILGAIPLWYGLIKDIKNGAFGVDLIAGVAIISTFLIGHYVAGVVVLLMLSGGQFLEEYAMNRAKREMKSLLSRTPKIVHVKKGNNIVDIAIEKVSIGMHIVIKPGEIIAIDGFVIEGNTVVDESVLTGESTPINKNLSDRVFTGTQNGDSVIVVEVDTDTTKTRYQAIIELVRQAEESKAPIVRLADTYSVYFTILTFTLATITWFISHDFVRVVSVLVVATPCPLILATPIAILSGMSKASQKGIIIKHGGALEKLARASIFVFDKTGTVTVGEPEVSTIHTFTTQSQNEIVTLAGSLDQLSNHILAKALQRYAKKYTVPLLYPTEFTEQFGDGVKGILNSTEYVFGKKTFVLNYTNHFNEEAMLKHTESQEKGQMIVFLATKKEVVGAIVFTDTLRKDATLLFKKIKGEGIKKTILLTGDHQKQADDVGHTLGANETISECLPEDKLKKIKELQTTENCIVMVGDGVNDAPALTLADVGIALGSHGETAASEAADIVILSESITRVYDVWNISKKTVLLAKHGISIGIGLSTIAMICGMFGYIQPLGGALLQEGIDIIVIINALRLGSILSKDK